MSPRHTPVGQKSESAEGNEASQGRSQSVPLPDVGHLSLGSDIYLHPNDAMISIRRHSRGPDNSLSRRHPVQTNPMTPLSPPGPITNTRSESLGLVLPPIHYPQPAIHWPQPTIHCPQPTTPYDIPANSDPPPPLPPQSEATPWYVPAWDNRDQRIISIGTPNTLDTSSQHDQQGASTFGYRENAMPAPTSSISMSNAPSPLPDTDSQASSPASSETSSNGPSSRGDGADWPPSHPDLTFTSQTPSNGNRHVCRLCATSFPRPSALRIHMNIHTGARPFRCPDPDCDATFTVNSNARRHYRLHGGDPTQINNRQFFANPTMPVTFHETQVLVNEHLAGSSQTALRWATPPIRPTRPQARRRKTRRSTPRKTNQ